MNAYLPNSISVRFTLLTFLLIVLLNTGYIIVESSQSIEREEDRLTDQIAQIEHSHTPAIIYGLWLTDEELVRSQIEAVVLFPYIEYVEVIDDEGRIFREGNKTNESLSIRSRDLYYTRRGAEFPVGRMHIYFDENKIRSTVLRAEFLYGLGQLIGALIVAGAVAFLFNRMVGRHVRQLARYAKHSKDPEPAEVFRLDRSGTFKDELQSLVEGVNEMRQSLIGYIEEREILMKEIHHRVKNDLGFIISLLSLQAHRSSSPEAAKALDEAVRRLKVMSDIYRQIYSAEDFHEIEVSTVFNNVVTDFIRKGLLLPGAVDLSMEVVVVPLKVSISLGIILNELLTNSLKYFSGAPEELKIRVKLTAHAAPRHYAEIVVSDNGEGFPEEVLENEHPGFGLTIVKALVEQHSGTLDMYNRDGAHVEIRI